MIEPLLQAERALATGLLDQAEALFGATAEADPRNAIAIVGLARVALERGDETTALRLGREALVLDPANPVAQRLVGRLSEVVAHREGVTPDVEPTPETELTPAGEAAPEPDPESAPRPLPLPPILRDAGPPAASPPAPRRRGLLARLFRRR